MSRTADMSTAAMLEPLKHAFHPDRGIGQGDTPSTLIFIAVFDILLTLVNSSDTGEAHAYADDRSYLPQPRPAAATGGPSLWFLRLHWPGDILSESRGHLHQLWQYLV
jgi:hypothetical protein